jgi:hypothetical protein
MNSHIDTLRPSQSDLSAGHESRKHSAMISHAAHHSVNTEENINRLLSIADPCCVPECKRKHIYWTPKGKFCGKHRDEAIAAMAGAKAKMYGRA